MADNDASLLGRKVFFLYPSAFIQDTIIDQVIQQEFEVYIIKDDTRLQRVLRKYPDSIVFAYIDETRQPAQRETWIKQIMDDKALKGVDIGVISSVDDEETRRLFLGVYKVSCGFFSLKMDSAEMVKALLDMLEAAEAKGRRKYIRVETQGETRATINISFKNGNYATGEILDISAVGLSCVFSEDPRLEKNSLLPNTQIKLQTALIKLDGIVLGYRIENSRKVYVILFPPKTDPDMRKKIRVFIQKQLQSKLDAEIR